MNDLSETSYNKGRGITNRPREEQARQALRDYVEQVRQEAMEEQQRAHLNAD